MTEHTNYDNVDDYNPPEIRWIDITTLGSVYQVQVDMNNAQHFRHRNVSLYGPWIKGKPDD